MQDQYQRLTDIGQVKKITHIRESHQQRRMWFHWFSGLVIFLIHQDLSIFLIEITQDNMAGIWMMIVQDATKYMLQFFFELQCMS